MSLRTVSILTLLALGAGGWYHYSSSGDELTSYRVATVEAGEIEDAVTATGTLNAVTTVQVGSQVSGRIAELLVDFNDQVERGQVIARIDSAPFAARVAQARATLTKARAALQRTSAAVDVSRANLLVADADIRSAESRLQKTRIIVVDTRRTYQRMKELGARELVAQSDVDQAETRMKEAEADVGGLEAGLQSAEAKKVAAASQVGQALAEVEAARAEIENSRANLELAETNLEFTRILSPIDGIVISRDVDVGQTVAASFQAPVLFLIADDLSRMQITANVDEADIGRAREGQKVAFTVDAYPDRQFQGKVSQIRLAPIVSSNVVTYHVVVDVKNGDLSLKPGMTANATIRVAYREEALRVPNAALAFTPPDTDSVKESRSGRRGDPGASGGRRGDGGGGSRKGSGRRGERGRRGKGSGDHRPGEGTGGSKQGQDGAGSGADAGGSPGQRPIKSPIVKTGTVHIVRDGETTAVEVRTGITDGTYTEVVSGSVQTGDEVAVGISKGGAGSAPTLRGMRRGTRSPRI